MNRGDVDITRAYLLVYSNNTSQNIWRGLNIYNSYWCTVNGNIISGNSDTQDTLVLDGCTDMIVANNILIPKNYRQTGSSRNTFSANKYGKG